MKSLTIRDLRLRWPAAEKALETEEEIVITRDGNPVAKLVRLPEILRSRPRFNPQTHMAKLRKIFKGRTFDSIDKEFAESRKDRT